MRYALVIDLDKCVGCHTCEIACKAENLTPMGDFRCRLVRVENNRTPYETWLRLSCAHCDNPSCVPKCPVKAITKKENGLVVTDRDACIGCGTCVQVCPYHAVTRSSGQSYFDEPQPFEEIAQPYQQHPKMKADKCTFCAHLLEQGKDPKCVSACISGALIFGDLDDPKSAVAQAWKHATPLMASTGNGPGIACLQKNPNRANMAEVDHAVSTAGLPDRSAGLS